MNNAKLILGADGNKSSLSKGAYYFDSIELKNSHLITTFGNNDTLM